MSLTSWTREKDTWHLPLLAASALHSAVVTSRKQEAFGPRVSSVRRSNTLALLTSSQLLVFDDLCPAFLFVFAQAGRVACWIGVSSGAESRMEFISLVLPPQSSSAQGLLFRANVIVGSFLLAQLKASMF